ncbi:hypothetical protein ACTVZO_32425 [Streptomyces sp. IBSNAI002]|uniref:hypothetical protein n=1 Tax=Streptomyces sp. IBSNAI002 TaxID=3457500 RepID=UPI003FD4B120
MSFASRRNVLTVLASAAASVPLGSMTAAASPRAAAPAAAPAGAPAAAPAAVAGAPVPPALTSPRSSVTMPPLEPSYFAQVSLGAPSAKVLPEHRSARRSPPVAPGWPC